MKSADIDKEILTALFDKILKSEEKTGSFKVSEETKKLFEEIINSEKINKKYIKFFHNKIIELLRKNEVENNWENLKSLKLKEKETILEDINNIDTFLTFYYLVKKNIRDKIHEYIKKWDKNNLLEKNILFLEKLEDKIEDFKNDELYKNYKNEFDLILSEIKLIKNKKDSEDEDFLINNWKIKKPLLTEEKIIVIKNINNKKDLILFFDKFQNSLKSLKPRDKKEIEIVKDYLSLFFKKLLEFEKEFKNKKEIEYIKKSIKHLEYFKDTFFLSKKDRIKKHWKDRTKLTLDDKIYILEKIINLEEKEKKEDLNLFINQFEGNIENMTSRTLEKWNKKDISKLNNFFIELLQEIKKYELKINTKTIHKLEKNITKLTKNQ